MSISHITQIEKPEKAVISTILTRYTARMGNFLPPRAVSPGGERGKGMGEMPKSGDDSALALEKWEC